MADENDNEEEGEEVPMLHLASFALHKLFSEWQSEGFEIPDFKIGATTTPMETTAAAIDKVLNAPSVPPKRTTLPENANTMHPTTLLCMVSVCFRFLYPSFCFNQKYFFLPILRCARQPNTSI